jgi:hypothetical protein
LFIELPNIPFQSKKESFVFINLKAKKIDK